MGVQEISYNTPAERKAVFSKARKDLETCYGQFLNSIGYLRSLRRRPTVNKKRGTTYVIKHEAEHWLAEHGVRDNYIREGAFIAAALYLGFKFEQLPDSSTGILNIANRKKYDYLASFRF